MIYYFCDYFCIFSWDIFNFVFIMYCKKTNLKVKNDFTILQVHFSAINCWNPGSECRLQHNKIPSWPILMAYTVTSRGVLYKGRLKNLIFYYFT